MRCWSRIPNPPFRKEQKKHFTGLKYYPENPKLSFIAGLEQADHPSSVKVATSTSGEETLIHVGQFRFKVDGKEAILQVYEEEQGGYFIPFVDATAPAETYGAGRYVNAHGHDDGSIHVDFNYAYNPSCAYNENWSCPLPPAENRLKVRIEAGEKKYLDSSDEKHANTRRNHD